MRRRLDHFRERIAERRAHRHRSESVTIPVPYDYALGNSAAQGDEFVGAQPGPPLEIAEQHNTTFHPPPPISDTDGTDLPLPSDVFEIISRHLVGHTSTLLHLAHAIPFIRHFCWKEAFKLVHVAIRDREGRKHKLTSNVDLFLQLITSYPRILFYIGGLDIQDYGRYNYNPSLNPISQQDLTTLAMLLVQSQRMPNLRTFRIRSAKVWATFPKPLQAAFITLFQSPSLEEVWLADLGLPINLLALAPRLQTVDIQTGGTSVSIVHSLVSLTPRKKIHTLKIRDRNPFGQAVQTLGLIDPRKGPRVGPFSLPHLKHLEICLPGNRLDSIQPGLSLCSGLQTLKLFVGTAGGLPTHLDLSSSPSLKSLSLSADITSLLESEQRFQWLIDALSTLQAVPVLEDLTLLIRTDTLARGRQCDWNLLDDIFVDSDKWHTLQGVNIIWCTARRDDLRQELNQDFVNDLPAILPCLSERGVVRVQTTYSDVEFNFWTFNDSVARVIHESKCI